MIGGGLAGLSSAVALAEAGFRVRLFELRPHLGGRATSYWLPDGSHVDNCQHVTLGCCTNLDDFYRRVGAADKIRYYKRLFFADSQGRRGGIGPSLLPPPLHLAFSFLGFPSLAWIDKFSIGRAMLEITHSAGRPADAPGMSMLQWLRRHGQSQAAIERFWRVVLVSALNEELDRTEAQYGVDVFWKGFLSTRRGFEVGIPSVPLAELYDGCLDAIVKRGGDVSLRAGIREILLEGDRASGVRLDDGSTVFGDYLICTVPPDALLKILPASLRDSEAVFSRLQFVQDSPITGIHLWYDRQVMKEPFLTLLDYTTQWIFNKTLLFEAESEGIQPGSATGQHLQLVISASYDLVERPRGEIIDLCCAELGGVLPATRHAQLLKSTVIKEVHATFSPVPGCQQWRPPQRSPVFGLLLAGDWTDTGWPATMEGAVRSGYLAAEGVLAAEGCPRIFLRPDLAPEGFAGLFHKSGNSKEGN